MPLEKRDLCGFPVTLQYANEPQMNYTVWCFTTHRFCQYSANYAIRTCSETTYMKEQSMTCLHKLSVANITSLQLWISRFHLMKKKAIFSFQIIWICFYQEKRHYRWTYQSKMIYIIRLGEGTRICSLFYFVLARPVIRSVIRSVIFMIRCTTNKYINFPQTLTRCIESPLHVLTDPQEPNQPFSHLPLQLSQQLRPSSPRLMTVNILVPLLDFARGHLGRRALWMWRTTPGPIKAHDQYRR